VILHITGSPLKNFSFTEENFIKAANGEKLSYNLAFPFYTWFRFWQNEINNIIKPWLFTAKNIHSN
jgi:hypothetical protein